MVRAESPPPRNFRSTFTHETNRVNITVSTYRSMTKPTYPWHSGVVPLHYVFYSSMHNNVHPFPEIPSAVL